MKNPVITKSSHSVALLVLLCTSLALRLLMIIASGSVVHHDGGEYFISSQQLHTYLVSGDFYHLFRVNISGHWGGLLFGTIPFFFQTDFLAPERMSGIFFVLPQVVNVYLIYLIAIALKFGARAGWIAAFLYAFSFSSIYQARHVLPHDLALMFFLCSVWVVARADTVNNKKAIFLAGFFSFLAFFTYYGYWPVAGLALLFAATYRVNNAGKVILRGIVGGMGFVLPLVSFYLAGRWYGIDLAEQFFRFSHTIVYGDFDGGYSVPFAFLFSAEKILLIVWLSSLCVAVFNLRDYSVQCVVLGVLLLYFMLVLTSYTVNYFVVYGRLARQLTPMLCLLSGMVLARVNFKYLIPLMLAISIEFTFHYVALYHMVFDSEFEMLREQLVQKGLPEGREFRQINICVPHRPKEVICQKVPTNCSVLHSSRYPLSYPFFQYDGISAVQSARISGFNIFRQILDCPKIPLAGR